MSPASYLAAPPRVAASSISAARYDRLVLVWLVPLLVSLAVSAAGAAYAGVHGLLAWRALRSAQESVGGPLAEVSAAAAAAAERAAALSERSGEVAVEAARLQRSLATLQLLVGAAGEANATLGA